MLPFCPTILLAKPFLNSENYGLERLAATVDSYFDLGQSQIVFLSKQDQVITVEELSAKDRKFKPGSMNCTLKILSYLLIIPLVIALIFKCVLRLALYIKYNFKEYCPFLLQIARLL